LENQVLASIDAELRDLNARIADTEKWAQDGPERPAAELVLASLRNRREYILQERKDAVATASKEPPSTAGWELE
jgi:hypothetical protein